VEFNLTIRLGNSAMQSGEDIARALDKVANSAQDLGEIQEGDAHGARIMDANGNAVGEWSITK
jgi:hypothetical protein